MAISWLMVFGGGKAERESGNDIDQLQNPAPARFSLTLTPASTALLGQEGRARGVLEDFPDAIVGLGRAFEVVSSTDLLLHFFTLFAKTGLAGAYIREYVR